MDGFASKGILTNTMKLIRYEARNFFKDQIEAMYSEGELKLWLNINKKHILNLLWYEFTEFTKWSAKAKSFRAVDESGC